MGISNPQLFTSGSDEWTTPRSLFDPLNREFRFRFDMAATAENTLSRRWYGLFHPDPLRRNGLDPLADPVTSWGFCNPPYSRGLQSRFIEVCAGRRSMVMLLPARTDTKAFHKYIYDARRWRWRAGVSVRFLPGRLKFGGAVHGAPFPSMVVIFR